MGAGAVANFLLGDLYDRVGFPVLIAAFVLGALFTPLVIPPGLQYRLPEPLPSVLVEYRNAFGGHPAYRWVIDVYRRHRGVSAEVAA